MAINKEQFEENIKALQNIHLSPDVKSAMKTRLMHHATTHMSPLQSPYMTHFHFSYKVFASAFVLLFSISIGTSYASQASLPGDLLYPIKTNITERLIKFTKVTPEEKQAFDLSLADKRIEEVQELIKTNTLTEAKLDENLALFEKHLDEKKKDTLAINNVPTTNATPEINTMSVFSREENSDTDLDTRISTYRNLIRSKPALNAFYEKKIKMKLHDTENNDMTENALIDSSNSSQDTQTQIEDSKKENFSKEDKEKDILKNKKHKKIEDENEDEDENEIDD